MLRLIEDRRHTASIVSPPPSSLQGLVDPLGHVASVLRTFRPRAARVRHPRPHAAAGGPAAVAHGCPAEAMGVAGHHLHAAGGRHAAWDCWCHNMAPFGNGDEQAGHLKSEKD